MLHQFLIIVVYDCEKVEMVIFNCRERLHLIMVTLYMDPYGIFNIQDYWEYWMICEEENLEMLIEKAICKLGLDEEILARIPSMKEKVDKLNFIKI